MNARVLIGLLLLATLATAQVSVEPTDNHLQLCHKEFLRMYRVEVRERHQYGKERKGWSRFYLIDDRKPEDRAEIGAQLKFYRENKIRVDYFSTEGTLPE